MRTEGALFIKWAKEIKAIKVGENVIYSQLQETSSDSEVLIDTKPIQLELDMDS